MELNKSKIIIEKSYAIVLWLYMLLVLCTPILCILVYLVKVINIYGSHTYISITIALFLIISCIKSILNKKIIEPYSIINIYRLKKLARVVEIIGGILAIPLFFIR